MQFYKNIVDNKSLNFLLNSLKHFWKHQLFFKKKKKITKTNCFQCQNRQNAIWSKLHVNLFRFLSKRKNSHYKNYQKPANAAKWIVFCSAWCTNTLQVNVIGFLAVKEVMWISFSFYIACPHGNGIWCCNLQLHELQWHAFPRKSGAAKRQRNERQHWQ